MTQAATVTLAVRLAADGTAHKPARQRVGTQGAGAALHGRVRGRDYDMDLLFEVMRRTRGQPACAATAPSAQSSFSISQRQNHKDSVDRGAQHSLGLLYYGGYYVTEGLGRATSFQPCGTRSRSPPHRATGTLLRCLGAVYANLKGRGSGVEKDLISLAPMRRTKPLDRSIL